MVTARDFAELNLWQRIFADHWDAFAVKWQSENGRSVARPGRQQQPARALGRERGRHRSGRAVADGKLLRSFGASGSTTSSRR